MSNIETVYDFSTLQRLSERVVQWNYDCGTPKETLNDGSSAWVRLLRRSVKQADYTLEEAKEVVDAENDEDVIDGIADTFVTLMFHLELAESLGYDVEKAITMVMDNNYKKVFQTKEQADYEMEKLQQANPDKEYRVVESSTGTFTIRDEHDKIQKPLGFTKVDLTPAMVGFRKAENTLHSEKMLAVSQ